MFESFLAYKSGRWLRWAAALVVVAIVSYGWQDLPVDRNGGTPVGYALGTIAAILMVWLTWLGRRKRNYHSNFGSVLGWTSAHVYLGSALVVIATLHTGFQFGSNVHTLAYVLMLVVCLSGLYGVWVYSRYPYKITGNSKGKMRNALFEDLKEEDRQIGRLSARLEDEDNKVIRGALERTEFGRTYLDQLMAKDRSKVQIPGRGLCDNKDMQGLADHLVAQLQASQSPARSEALQGILSRLGQRALILSRIREDVRLVAILKVWLFVHVPVAFAALAALAAHIFSVFVYW